MRITRRNLALFVCGGAAAWSAAAVADSKPDLIGPSVFEWSSLAANTTEVGEIRQVTRGPTATLDELEIHVTTLKPGVASHPPHQHPNEELVIVREGQVETLSGGTWKKAGPGSIIFNASNSSHALRNVGAGPATYDVINWKSAATPR